MPIIYDAPAYTTPTFGELVDEVVGNLQGYTLTPDMVTYLTADLSATALTVPIDMPDGGCGTGVVEIGDELMYVTTVDVDSGALTLLPRGRGWRGTDAAVHASGDTVVISPLVPRHRVKKAINDVVTQIWPTLFGVDTVEFDWVPGPTLAYELPAEAEQILDVRYQDRYGNWNRVRRFEAVRSTNTTSFASGSALRITENPPFATTVQVVYGKRPTGLSDETLEFTESGLSASAKDVLVLGAMARLVPALDAGRLAVQYVPADELDQPRQVGSASALAREFKREFAEAVLKEQQALQRLYPARVHFITAR